MKVQILPRFFKTSHFWIKLDSPLSFLSAEKWLGTSGKHWITVVEALQRCLTLSAFSTYASIRSSRAAFITLVWDTKKRKGENSWLKRCVAYLQLLMTEIHKTKRSLCLPFMKDIFMQQGINYGVKHADDAQLPKIRATVLWSRVNSLPLK